MGDLFSTSDLVVRWLAGFNPIPDGLRYPHDRLSVVLRSQADLFAFEFVSTAPPTIGVTRRTVERRYFSVLVVLVDFVIANHHPSAFIEKSSISSSR